MVSNLVIGGTEGLTYGCRLYTLFHCFWPILDNHNQQLRAHSTQSRELLLEAEAPMEQGQRGGGRELLSSLSAAVALLPSLPPPSTVPLPLPPAA